MAVLLRRIEDDGPVERAGGEKFVPISHRVVVGDMHEFIDVLIDSCYHAFVCLTDLMAANDNNSMHGL